MEEEHQRISPKGGEATQFEVGQSPALENHPTPAFFWSQARTPGWLAGAWLGGLFIPSKQSQVGSRKPS